MTTAVCERNPTVTRSVCERYDIRLGGMGWAVIMLDERGGVLQINSDFGNWSYNWPYHGRETFKHFIVELGRDTEYLMGKLGSRDYFLHRETEAAWRKEALSKRRQGMIDKRIAREAWDAMDAMEWASPEDCYRSWDGSKALVMAIDEPTVVRDWDPGLKQFIARVWPVFVDAIRRELV